MLTLAIILATLTLLTACGAGLRRNLAAQREIRRQRWAATRRS